MQDSVVAQSLSSVREKQVRKLVTFPLVIMGALLITGTILELPAFSSMVIGGVHIHDVTKLLFYSSIGILCIVLGLERALDINRINTALDNQNQVLKSMLQHVSSMRQFRLIRTQDEVLEETLNLLSLTQSRVRIIYSTESPKFTDAFVAEMVRIVKEKDAHGRGVDIEMVICTIGDKPDYAFMERADKLTEIYKANGIDKYIHRYVLSVDKQIAPSCVISDEKHLMLGYPTLRGNMAPKGMFIENQPEIVVEFVNWFGTFILANAVRYEDYKRSFVSAAPAT